MPDNTKDDDDSGFIGLNAVPARLNETIPDMTLIAPAIAKLTASDSRAGNTKSNAGTVHETSHISAADTRTRRNLQVKTMHGDRSEADA